MEATKAVSTTLIPNLFFAQLASDEQIEHTVKALERNGIHMLVAENSEPLEDARLLKAAGVHSAINRLLIIAREGPLVGLAW